MNGLIGLRYKFPVFLNHKERTLQRLLKKMPKARVLDVGCGNHSVAKLKAIAPDIEYWGVDKGEYNNDHADFASMDNFSDIDLDGSNLLAIPDRYFDIIIFSHVIEHLNHGDIVLAVLTRKLKPGGLIYVEYPGPKSLTLPHNKGTLHFCDDSTHIRVYDIKEVSNSLLRNGCEVVMAGVARTFARMMLFPAMYLAGLAIGNTAGAFWEWYGFAEFVLAKRRD